MRNRITDHDFTTLTAALAVPARGRAIPAGVAAPVVVVPFIVPVHRMTP